MKNKIQEIDWEIVEIVVYNDTNNTNRNKDENPDKEKV